MEFELQKDFEKAIRKRQKNDPKCLNPDDIEKALGLAMKTIIKENVAVSEQGVSED